MLCSLCSFVLCTLIISDPVYETPPFFFYGKLVILVNICNLFRQQTWVDEARLLNLEIAKIYGPIFFFRYFSQKNDSQQSFVRHFLKKKSQKWQEKQI